MDDINVKAKLITGEDIELKAGINTEAVSRDKLVTSDANYLPLKRIPESRLAYTADQCVQVVLDHSQEARDAFSKVIDAWLLPGCFQPIYSDAWQQRGRIKHYTDNALKYDTRNGNAGPWPSIANYLGMDMADYYNADTHQLQNCINELILKHFNRKEDLDNGGSSG
ncbi:hypothetical protein ACFLV6_00715 [Chloroflexota bacterium]